MKTKTAINVMLVILGAVSLFHLSILLRFIPYEITWGGRLENEAEMVVFESISILIIVFLGLILLIKGEYIQQLLPPKIVTIVLWIYLLLFGLNTVGNMFAKTTFEKSFALLTLVICVLIWFILKEKKPASTKQEPD
jgi:hypothetical protein